MKTGVTFTMVLAIPGLAYHAKEAATCRRAGAGKRPQHGSGEHCFPGAANHRKKFAEIGLSLGGESRGLVPQLR